MDGHLIVVFTAGPARFANLTSSLLLDCNYYSNLFRELLLESVTAAVSEITKLIIFTYIGPADNRVPTPQRFHLDSLDPDGTLKVTSINKNSN